MYSKQIPVGVRKACLVMKTVTFWSRRQELEDVPHCPCCFSKDWSEVRAEQLILSQMRDGKPPRSFAALLPQRLQWL